MDINSKLKKNKILNFFLVERNQIRAKEKFKFKKKKQKFN